MEVPTERLDEWAKDLDNKISAVREQVGSLQRKLADLEAKRSALDCLRGVGRNGRGDKVGSSPAQTSSGHAIRTSASAAGQDDHAPQTAYRVPILEVLADLGGKGHVEEVLPKVKQNMERKGVFGPKDYEDVPSGTEERWRNTTRWERKTMVDRGLLRSGSPRGIWEITREGEEWLTKNRP